MTNSQPTRPAPLNLAPVNITTTLPEPSRFESDGSEFTPIWSSLLWTQTFGFIITVSAILSVVYLPVIASDRGGQPAGIIVCALLILLANVGVILLNVASKLQATRRLAYSQRQRIDTLQAALTLANATASTSPEPEAPVIPAEPTAPVSTTKS